MKKRIIVLCISEESAKYAEGTFVKGSYTEAYNDQIATKPKRQKTFQPKKVKAILH